jgi:TPR repeat protein
VKSREYHLAAAKLGEPRSMFDLGTIYEYGMGITADIVEAAKWYKLSADYGSAQGQYNIATMFETGEGVPQDLVEAFKYFLLAAEQGFYGVGYDPVKQKGDTTMPTPIELLSKKVTADQAKEAHVRADAFKPLTGPLKN